MLSRVQSFVLQGIDASLCEIEVDVAESGLAKETIVGLPDAAVKESIERVRSAVTNVGYRFPLSRLLVNLAPADVKKEGPVYDLPIAVGLLMADGVIEPSSRRGAGRPEPVRASELPAGVEPTDLDAQLATLEEEPREAEAGWDPIDARAYLFAGELALDGRVRPVRGALAMALLARDRGMRGVVVPAANATEAAVVEGIEVLGVETIAEVVGLLNGTLEPCAHPPVDVSALIEHASAEVDFADVRGQESVKRAIVVAAAGGHNLLMLGPAGTGKTMMAKALPGVLPPLTAAEALEVTRIYSAVGRLESGGGANDGGVRGGGGGSGGGIGGGHGGGNGGGIGGGLVTVRPVRSPHHTASAIAVIGGGAVPKPGEISLAHHGVLFLDELPEFPRTVLDTLRQPLEDGCVTIARAHSAVKFPARFMLVAAMNPTPKGDMPTDEVSRRAMERYLGRLSRPLVDRVDIHVEAPAVPWRKLAGGGKQAERGSSSAEMRARVLAARERQRARQGPILNSTLTGRQLDGLAEMDDEATSLLGQAMTELGLSARAYDKIRRVARTIADIEGEEQVSAAAVAEAVQYRLLDRSV